MIDEIGTRSRRRGAKIVATLGPSTSDPLTLKNLISAGIDVARINFAHGTVDQQRRSVEQVRQAAEEAGRPVGLLGDLPGPKMRTGRIKDGEVRLKSGNECVLVGADIEGEWNRVGTSVPNLPQMVTSGDEIFLADGAIVLSVRSVGRDSVVTEVVRGGILRSGKGMHFLAAERFFEPLTDRDRAALETAAELDIQLLGLSFIRSGDDVRMLRAALPPGYSPFVVAKIETRAAVENLDEVIREADAVMVARGDLGIQLPLEDVPEIQRSVIEACNRAATPVITATQLLESMTRSPLPTRAEVTDVANAVREGTDAVMLSEETAVGDHPVRVVETMLKIIRAAERSPAMRVAPVHEGPLEDPVSWAVAHAATLAAEDVGATAILCPTRSGATSRRVAAFRPEARIVALSSDSSGVGPLCLTWGVHPVAMDAINEDGLVVERSVARAVELDLVTKGDRVVVVSGSVGRVGGTDLMQVVEI